jgi:putative nucleotidyltransferase with HDIG domain
MEDTAHQRALEVIVAGNLRRVHGNYLELPTALFVRKIDIKMPPLPEIAFFEEASGEVRMIRAADQPYSPLALSAFEHVLIRTEDYSFVKSYAEGQILQAGNPGALPPAKRMETLRKTAMLVVEDLFKNPSPENVEKSRKVVSSFVYVLMKEPKAYLLLAKLSSHDPYTLQHSVGTAVNAIILARKIGIDDEVSLNEVGLAGLLHDIGKVGIKKEIINKQGPLNEYEWEEMRHHPQIGYDLVKDNPDVPEATKRAILEHHEEPGGTGYPNRLKSDRISKYAQIVCIADVFNALTTDRSYSNARTPYDAFHFMREKLGHKVDPELFRSLVLCYGGKMEMGEEE